MEELRSTEVLEAEILEDARKKAAKVLRTADDSLAQQKRGWGKKLDDDLESIRKAYMDRMKKEIDNIFSRLPLDKRRLRLKTHEEFLSGAINDFLSNLGRERILSILERELSRLLETVDFEAEASGIALQHAVVRYSDLSLSEAKEILKKNQLPYNWDFQEGFQTDDLSPDSQFPLIIIDTETFRLTASVEGAAAALLKENREELAVALLGQEARS